MRIWKITRLRSWLERFRRANEGVDVWKLLDWYDSLIALLGRARRFIDGEEMTESNKTAQQQYETKLIDKILRAVDAAMRQQLLALPDGTVWLPIRYYVFLAFDDDRLWFGSKREYVKASLHNALSDRLSELSQQTISGTDFTLDLLADPTLTAGHVLVKPVWDVGVADTSQDTARDKATSGREDSQAELKVSNLHVRGG